MPERVRGRRRPGDARGVLDMGETTEGGMKAFNMLEAKPGQKVQIKVRETTAGDSQWIDALFIGGNASGCPVVESDRYGLEYVDISQLRAVPKMRTLAVEIWRHERYGYSARVVDETGKASICEYGDKVGTFTYCVEEK